MPKLGPRRVQAWDGMREQKFSFPHKEAQKVHKSLIGHTIDNWRPPVLNDKHFENELLRVSEMLRLHSIYGNETHINPYMVLNRTIKEGPKFAKIWKNFRENSIRRTAGDFNAYELGPGDLNPIELPAWDSIFPAEFLIMWEDPLIKADYDLLSEEPRIKKGSEAIFKEAAQKFLRKALPIKPFFDTIDELSLMGARSNITKKGHKSYPKSYIYAYENTPGEMGKEGFFKTCPIVKNAAENRAAILPTQPTLRTLKVIERIIDCYYFNKTDQYFNFDLNEIKAYLSSNRDIYLMSDQKKCGLTFPRILIIWLLEVASEHSEEDFSKEISFLRNMHIYDEGNIELPWTLKGFGLGMCNGAVSAAVSILFEAFRTSEEAHMTGRFFGDDQVIRVPLQNRVHEGVDIQNGIELMTRWNAYMEDFGLSIHIKKPWIASQGQFCEIYGKDFPMDTTKGKRRALNLLWALSCENITSAKEYVSAVYPTIPDSPLKDAVFERVVLFWGKEFDQREIYWPFECGGWVQWYRESKNSLADFPWQCNLPQDRKALNFLHFKDKPKCVDWRRKAFIKHVRHLKTVFSNLKTGDIGKLDLFELFSQSLEAPNRGNFTVKRALIKYEKARQIFWNTCKPVKNPGEELKKFFLEKIEKGSLAYDFPLTLCKQNAFVIPQNPEKPGRTSFLREYEVIIERLGLQKGEVLLWTRTPDTYSDPRIEAHYRLSKLIKACMPEDKHLTYEGLCWLIRSTADTEDLWFDRVFHKIYTVDIPIKVPLALSTIYGDKVDPKAVLVPIDTDEDFLAPVVNGRTDMSEKAKQQNYEEWILSISHGAELERMQLYSDFKTLLDSIGLGAKVERKDFLPPTQTEELCVNFDEILQEILQKTKAPEELLFFDIPEDIEDDFSQPEPGIEELTYEELMERLINELPSDDESPEGEEDIDPG